MSNIMLLSQTSLRSSTMSSNLFRRAAGCCSNTCSTGISNHSIYFFSSSPILSKVDYHKCVTSTTTTGFPFNHSSNLLAFKLKPSFSSSLPCAPFSTMPSRPPPSGSAEMKKPTNTADPTTTATTSIAHKEQHDDKNNDHHDHHEHSTRDFLGPDGCRRVDLYTSDFYHWGDEFHEFDQPDVFLHDGQKMVRGVDTVPMEIGHCLSQANIPIYPRAKMFSWVNYDFVLKAEFLFFWGPTFIIFSMAVPCFTLLYMMDEAVYTTMTIKVIGRQWYWVYEVESPPADDEGE
eukprot:GHVS01032737.1.p1 GENE.GHVS01032737.1~~GHVS01032737.1.p1  ORF type:complete len:289 (+),score=49.03 GHVS01032737.1:168-1034(+)